MELNNVPIDNPLLILINVVLVGQLFFFFLFSNRPQPNAHKIQRGNQAKDGRLQPVRPDPMEPKTKNQKRNGKNKPRVS